MPLTIQKSKVKVKNNNGQYIGIDAFEGTCESDLPFVTPEMYGAVGDGVTDDSDAFESALATGNPVYVTGNYRVNHVVCITDATLIFAHSAKITRSRTLSENQSGIFEFRGAKGSTSLLTVDVHEGDQSVTVANAEYFSVGDLIDLFHTEQNGNKSRHITGIVTSITDNVLTMSSPAQWGFSVDDGDSVSKIIPIKVNISGNGATFDGGGLTGRGYSFFMKYCINSTVEGCAVQNSATGLLRMDECYNVSVENCTGKNPVTNDSPYGEFLSIAYSSHITARKIVTECYRRSVDYIGAVYCKTYDSYAFRGGFTAHGLMARYCEFVNCHSVTPTGEVAPISVVGNASYFGDKDIVYRECTFEGGQRGFYCLGTNRQENPDTHEVIEEGFQSTCKLISCILLNSTVNCMASYNASIEVYGCVIKSKRTAISISSTSNAFIKGCTITSSGAGSYDAIVNEGDPIVIEDCDFNISTLLFRSSPAILKNCRVREGSSTAATIGKNTKIIDCEFDKTLTISGADHVLIKNSIAKNVLSSGTNKYITIFGLITWDGTLGFVTDSTNNINVINASKISYSPL